MGKKLLVAAMVLVLVLSTGCPRGGLGPAVYEGVRTNEMLHERPQPEPPMNYQQYERERRERLEAAGQP